MLYLFFHYEQAGQLWIPFSCGWTGAFIYLCFPRRPRLCFSRFPASGKAPSLRCASFPGQWDYALCANPDFVRGRTKSACPAAAKSACLPFHPAPFSVSGKQRYNTLDFPGKVVCHETTGFFGFFRSKGKLSPLNTPGKGNAVPLCTPQANRAAPVPIGWPRAKGASPLESP